MTVAHAIEVWALLSFVSTCWVLAGMFGTPRGRL